MEWTKQTEDMFKTWTEAQTKMWDEWLRAMQGFSRPQASEAWGKSVEAWEESVKKTLDAQNEWTRLWAASFTTVSGTPKEMVEWARQGQEMVRRWVETQKQLWEGWFQIAKRLDPSKVGGSWEQEGQKFLQAWQDAVKKGMESQAEWTRAWTAGQAGKKPEAQGAARG